MQATTPEYRAYQEQVLSNSFKFAQVPYKRDPPFLYYFGS